MCPKRRAFDTKPLKISLRKQFSFYLQSTISFALGKFSLLYIIWIFHYSKLNWNTINNFIPLKNKHTHIIPPQFFHNPKTFSYKKHNIQNSDHVASFTSRYLFHAKIVQQTRARKRIRHNPSAGKPKINIRKKVAGESESVGYASAANCINISERIARCHAKRTFRHIIIFLVVSLLCGISGCFGLWIFHSNERCIEILTRNRKVLD